MIDKKFYDFLSRKGDDAQELFIEFMENEGHKFLAGDRNGKTINKEIIEEIARCSFVEPNSLGGKHGPRLVFSKSKKTGGYTMPDELFLLNSDDFGYRFFDVKNRTEKTLKEKFEKIIHYARVEYFTKIKTFLIIVIYNREEKGFNIYNKSVSKIYKENRNLRNEDYVYFDLSDFKKINKKAIIPKN